MLKKENCLRDRSEVDYVFKKGRLIFDKTLGIKFLKNKKNINQFVVIIGKKVSKKAVERNRIKRIIKSIIVLENKKLQQGYDYVFIVSPTIKELERKEIEDKIILNLKKTKTYV